MPRRHARKPQRGDLVVVKWADIAGAETGEPDPPVFETPGYWVGWKTLKGIRGLHVAKNRTVLGCCDGDGWDWYIKGAVLDVRVVE